MINFLKIDLSILHQFRGGRVSYADNIVYGALLGTIGAILSASGIFGGIGFLISALSTYPLLLAGLFSLRTGFLTYIVTFLILFVIQPSEAYVYLFTTGILGISMVFSFRLFKNVLFAILIPAIVLMLGILFLLIIVQFPVLGPSIGSNLDLVMIGYILLFTLVYSWIWVKGFLASINRYSAIIKRYIRQRE